jgi:glycosyltransferase involved in cell wall biosynthesis
MNKPLISVIIPVHNGALYLTEAIQSVLNQTYDSFEIIVVDDASQDQSAQIARSFPSVRYIYSTHANTALARNEGVLHAQGSYLAFLDQDDVWYPDKLQCQWDFLHKRPEVDAVVCHQKMVLQKGFEKPHWLKEKFLDTAQPAYLPSALLVKREIFEKMQAFDSAYSITSDVDWFFRAKHSGIQVEMLDQVLLKRRIHGENASNFCKQIHKEILSILRKSLHERRAKVSVILPVYNGEKYLKQAIESVLKQDYPNKELIVVDDGSTDSTYEIILHFGSKIRSIRQPNRGLGAARNKGISIATGEYFAFLDHDDLWEPSKLTCQMQKVSTEDPLIFGHVKQFICPSITEEEKQKLIVNEEILPAYFAGTLLVSKKRLLQIGPFFEKNTVGEFVDWYARALETKVPIIVLPELVLHRRIHQNNMGRQKDVYNRTEYLKILKESLDRRRSSHATTS